MISVHDSVVGNFWEHTTIFLAGSTALGIVAHAVNTFPTPSSPFGKWLLGIVQFVVGQRMQAQQNIQMSSDQAAVNKVLSE